MKNTPLMTVCQNYSTCFRVRKDDGTWVMFVIAPQSFLSEIRVSHGICPDCYKKALTQLTPPSTPRFARALPAPVQWEEAPEGETMEARCQRLERLFAEQRKALEELKCYVQAADDQISEVLKRFK